jgi:undecaprenyl-diphosphatase
LEQELAKFFWSMKDGLLWHVFSIISGKLYIFLATSILIIYAITTLKRKVLLFLLAAAISLILSDFLCYRVLKPAIKRLRPAVELNLHTDRNSIAKTNNQIHSARQLKDYSMPSNHASNSFAFFIVFFYLVRKYWGIALLNSILISASRIIIVKHYPTDVIAGIIFGSIIGFCIVSLLSKFSLNSDIFKNKDNASNI